MLDKNYDTVEVEDALVSPTQHALAKHGWRSFITGVFHKLAKQTLLFCIFIFLCALGLNLYRLGTPSIWFDEALSISRAQQPLSLLYQIVSRSQPNMTLYYFFLHFWLSFMAFWGLPPNEFVVRLPSAIFAASGSVMVFLLGRRFLGLSAGFTAAILYLLNDLQLVYTQDARAYSMQLLLLCLSWYAFFAIVTAETPRTRWWICYVTVAALTVYAQLFSFFVLLAQFSMFALLLIFPGPWRATLRKQGRTLMISAVSFFVLVIPMLLASRAGAKTGWLPIPHLHDIYYFFLTISEGGKPALLLNLLCILGS
ncbi:MAG: glycosyltransferase family 39 protein, partial [Ktedonobacteraceae bacterium]